MKGICLASGLGTRLGILTSRITNKHLLPILDLPMVFYPLRTLVQAGVDDIAIVVGGSHPDKFISTLGNGKELGIKNLHYIYQEKPLGIAQAVSLCEDFADHLPVAVILGDNIFDHDFSNAIYKFNKSDGVQATIFTKSVPDPERFGVAAFNKEGRIVGIQEKPKSKPKSDKAIVGMYLYDFSVFNVIKTLKPSARGELEITDVNNLFIKTQTLDHFDLGDSFWIDAGVPASILVAANYWANK